MIKENVKTVRDVYVSQRARCDVRKMEYNADREMAWRAISPQVWGDPEAMTSRPPMLQTHGATLGHCDCT